MAVALLTEPVAKGEVAGEGLTATFELELLAGSVAQPAAAKIERAITSPMVAFLIVFILDLPRLLILSDMRSGSLSYSLISILISGSWVWCWAKPMPRAKDSQQGWG